MINETNATLVQKTVEEATSITSLLTKSAFGFFIDKPLIAIPILIFVILLASLGISIFLDWLETGEQSILFSATVYSLIILVTVVLMLIAHATDPIISAKASELFGWSL